jgi:hypothetical protein
MFTKLALVYTFRCHVHQLNGCLDCLEHIASQAIQSIAYVNLYPSMPASAVRQGFRTGKVCLKSDFALSCRFGNTGKVVLFAVEYPFTLPKSTGSMATPGILETAVIEQVVQV